MKLAVIGASGKSGLKFVQLALEDSFEIKAGINRLNKIKSTSPNLEIVKCNALNFDEIENLISGCQAVVSLIGHGRKSPANLQTLAITNVIKAMKKQGISRLISLTGNGVRMTGDKITLIDLFLNFSIKLIDPNRIKDGISHADLIRHSELDWTILRVLKLHDLYESDFSLTDNGPAKVLVSRKEVARAIIIMLKNDSYFKRLPLISKIQ